MREHENPSIVRRFVEISVKGELDAASLEDLDEVVAITERGVTRLRARIRDDSAFYGLLESLQANDLEVLAVFPCDEVPAAPVDDRSPGGW